METAVFAPGQEELPVSIVSSGFYIKYFGATRKDVAFLIAACAVAD